MLKQLFTESAKKLSNSQVTKATIAKAVELAEGVDYVEFDLGGK
jgi:hypothetical protein